MNPGTYLVGYVRTSTEDQAASLTVQEAAIRAECAHRGWSLLRIECDKLSGKNTERPGLQRALESCRNSEAQGIVVSKLDRLSRSIMDFGKLLQEARKLHYNIVALDFGLDLSTPQGKLVANLLMSVAEWEREVIGQRIKEALAVKRAEGVRLGRPESIDPPLRRRIRSLRTRGWTLQRICDRLNAEEIPTAQGGDTWRPSSLQSLLRPTGRTVRG